MQQRGGVCSEFKSYELQMNAFKWLFACSPTVTIYHQMQVILNYQRYRVHTPQCTVDWSSLCTKPSVQHVTHLAKRPGLG